MPCRLGLLVLVACVCAANTSVTPFSVSPPSPHSPSSRPSLSSSSSSSARLADANSSVAIPTELVLQWQSQHLRTFHHFGICTFNGCEHNSGSQTWQSGSRRVVYLYVLHGYQHLHNYSLEYPDSTGPASSFAPKDADPEQWVLAAKAFGAGGAVLTARHEGGFCLYPSKFSNYTIAQSPLAGRDLVQEFVDACQKHGIRPSLYFAASCDGYHKTSQRMSNTDYVQTQLHMIAELVGTYKGLEYIWFDHHGNPPGHHNSSRCDFISSCTCDPLVDTFWRDVDQVMRQLAPDVLIGGLDLNIGETDSNGPNHFSTCNTTGAATYSRCVTPTAGVFGETYRPVEITGSAASRGWFWHPGTTYLHADQILAMHFGLISSGYNQILNFPPNSSGLLDDGAIVAMTEVGKVIGTFYDSEFQRISGMCTSDSSIVLTLPNNSSLGSIMLWEDLRMGQRVFNYSVTLSTEGTNYSLADETIGQQRIYTVRDTQDSYTHVVLYCLGVVGTANVTIAALSQSIPTRPFLE